MFFLTDLSRLDAQNLLARQLPAASSARGRQDRSTAAQHSAAGLRDRLLDRHGQHAEEQSFNKNSAMAVGLTESKAACTTQDT